MIFYPGVMVPRCCPLCGRTFWKDDGHAPVDLDAATGDVAGHAFRVHGGQLALLHRGHDTP